LIPCGRARGQSHYYELITKPVFIPSSVGGKKIIKKFFWVQGHAIVERLTL
jgi:hypothetical protein